MNVTTDLLGELKTPMGRQAAKGYRKARKFKSRKKSWATG
jgi:hypothetical protein